MSDKLKACPFCGSVPKQCFSVGNFWVKCTTCGIDTPYSGSANAASSRWNQRHTPEYDELKGHIEQCIKELASTSCNESRDHKHDNNCSSGHCYECWTDYLLGGTNQIEAYGGDTK